MDYCNIIVIKDNVVDESYLLTGDNVSEAAEKLFLELCGKHLSNFDEYTKENIDAMLEDGYEKFGNGSICISWPTLPNLTVNAPEVQRPTARIFPKNW